ncbi:MAG: lycopene cyclase family protein [Ilumatobacteraceae bacterium]
MNGPDLDVLVVGDGPAGLALAAACRQRDLRVVVAGPGQPWTATYATWTDDVPELPATCYASVSPEVVVHGRRRHVLTRPYGVLDGAALAAQLGGGLERCTTTARAAQHFEWGTRLRTDDGDLDTRLVVDATGRTGPSWSGPRLPPVAWQTAYGVVVEAPPNRFDADRPTVMDLRPVAAADDRSTFCYGVPVAAG